MLKATGFHNIQIIFLTVCSLVTLRLSAQGNRERTDLLRNAKHENHITGKDIGLIDSAFKNGYTDNIVYVDVDGRKFPTLNIQSTDGNVYKGGGRTTYSIWTRDLYWGFLGWSQAGDESVLPVMRSSLCLLLMAKNKNQALGQSKTWPLNDKRFYIPQAYTTGLSIAMDFFPWCSESQTDFLLLAHNYWKLSGDRRFIDSIWNDIVYVTETLELLDSNGNSLPDALQGSYDYQGVGLHTEEPLMCAKTSMAYKAVAELARMLGKRSYAAKLEKLAAKVKATMNKDVAAGGLWKKTSDGGYYVNMRHIDKGEKGIDDRFIPYENLVSVWCGMTDHRQDEAIFSKLDDGFEKYYDLTYGPMYCAPAVHNDQSVMDCSSVTWLAFLDVYLRGKKGHDANRAKIFSLLMKHARDAGGIPFPEGAGIYGSLTGGAGRAWDNGNFFHLLLDGIYGIGKDKDGIMVTAPEKIEGVPLTALQHVCWREAVYDFTWSGEGKHIQYLSLDGKKISPRKDIYRLQQATGHHQIEIRLAP